MESQQNRDVRILSGCSVSLSENDNCEFIINKKSDSYKMAAIVIAREFSLSLLVLTESVS